VTEKTEVTDKSTDIDDKAKMPSNTENLVNPDKDTKIDLKEKKRSQPK